MRRLSRALCAGVVGWVLAGLHAPPAFAELLRDRVVEHGGLARTFDLYVPAMRSGERPLVILLHGHGADADVMTGANGRKAPYRQWFAIADREGLLLAIPDGSVGPDGRRGWNDCRGDLPSNPHADDVGFILAMIEWIAGRHALDRRRIHVMGTSNGGHMALRLALEVPERFASVAAVAASMPANNQCRVSEAPVAVAFMNGTRDRFNRYAGGVAIGRSRQSGRGGIVLSTGASADWWRRHNGCSGPPRVFEYPDLELGDRSRVRRLTYSVDCPDAPVVLFEVQGGGHTEPSRAQRYARPWQWLVGPQNHDIEMAEEIWSFFRDLRR